MHGTVVAVAFDRDADGPKRMVRELQIPFTVVHDADAHLAPRLRLDGFSPLYLFGPSGEIVARYEHCNRQTVDELLRILSKLAQ